MTKFSFRLQRVLELREKKEQAMATQAAAARAQADAARAAREALEHIRSAGRERLHEAHAALPSVGELQQIGLVLEALDTRVAQASTTHAAAEQAARAAQEQLAEAFRDRRVLDRLKEKQQDAWRAEATRQDPAAMDGIALTRFVQDAALRESARVADAPTAMPTPAPGATPARTPDEDR